MTTSPIVTRLRFLFLSYRGRIPRSSFWLATLGSWTAFVILFLALDAALGQASTLLLYLPFYWAWFALSAKRYHDLGKSAWRLSLLLLPILGPMWVAIELGLRRGTRGDNRFGPEQAGAPAIQEAAA